MLKIDCQLYHIYYKYLPVSLGNHEKTQTPVERPVKTSQLSLHDCNSLSNNSCLGKLIGHLTPNCS